MDILMECVDGLDLRPTAALRAVGPAQARQRALDCKVAGYAARCVRLWAEAGARCGPDSSKVGALEPGAIPTGTGPSFGRPITLAEKLSREQRADRDLKLIEGMLRRWPAVPARRGPWRQELLLAVRRLAREHLGHGAQGLNQLLTDEGLEATRQFVRQARAFAPAISDTDLFQALRNVWVTHSVQLLLRAPVTLSPAVFAYSMLYPWTDNHLDSPQLGKDAKTAFGHWLTLRLAGEEAEAPDTHCDEVSALVARIEEQYPRPDFPEIYLGLQAIHRAQMQSLEQQEPTRNWDERALLDLSMAKGGASVLADALLVRGRLAADEGEFMFAYGVVLQLMDDLQDVRDDLANGHVTIFTRQAELGALDGLTQRLWAFAVAVYANLNRWPSAQSGSLKDLLQENLRLLLLQSVARNQRFYTAAFVRLLEETSPLGFCYLARQEKTLSDRYSKVLASIRQRRKLHSLFEMLD